MEKVCRSLACLFLLVNWGLHAQTHSHSETKHDDHGHHDHDDHHGHDHENPKTVKTQSITLWDENYEYFVEFLSPHAGSTVQFVIHITNLDDWQPIKQGGIQLKQIPERGPSKTTAVAEPAREGIYLAELKFPIAGQWRLQLNVSETTGTPVTATIPVEVFPTEDDLPHAEGGEDDAVVFLKEQQWRMPFVSEEVNLKPMQFAIDGIGEIMPHGKGEVHITAPLPGRFLFAEEQGLILGDTIEAGQVLGYLMPTFEGADDPARLELEVAQAQLELDFEEDNLSRTKQLSEQRVIAAQEVREAQLRVRRAAQALATAKKRASLFQTSGDTSQRIPLRAPISGRITQSDAIAGAFYEPGETIFRIMDMSLVWLNVQTPARYLANAETPSDVLFRLEGSAKTHRVSALGGHLITVADVVDRESRMVSVIFALPNPQRMFKIGMSATASLLTGITADALLIPRSAVVEDKGQPTVFVQIGGEAFEKRLVRLGLEQGDQVQVTSGLHPSERIVKTGAYQLLLASEANLVIDHGHAH